MIPVNIAFGNKSRVGKDYAAEILSKWINIIVVKFAAPIYEIIAEINKKGVSFANVLNSIKFLNISIPTEYLAKFAADIIEFIKVNKIDIAAEKPRSLLQYVGERAKEYNPDVWVENLDRKIAAILSKNNKLSIICTDLRFINEAKMLQKYGFVFVRVNNPKAPVFNHISERALDNWEYDYTIVNDDNFVEKIAALLDQIYARKNKD